MAAIAAAAIAAAVQCVWSSPVVLQAVLVWKAAAAIAAETAWVLIAEPVLTTAIAAETAWVLIAELVSTTATVVEIG